MDDLVKFFEGGLFIDKAKTSKTTERSAYKIKSWYSDNHWICFILLLIVVFYYEGLCFRHFLFVYFVGRMIIVYCASYYFWELRDRKGKSRSHLSSADSTNRLLFELLVFDRNDFKNYRFVVVDLVCMFNFEFIGDSCNTTITNYYDSSHQLITAREMCSMVKIDIEYGKQ